MAQRRRPQKVVIAVRVEPPLAEWLEKYSRGLRDADGYSVSFSEAVRGLIVAAREQIESRRGAA